ncbi:serine--tRNA ligase [Candidatus Saccharibacteria bacterium]|nr:serine--tRNA ligase [Candidatus Saccharibacteria bacterium]
MLDIRFIHDNATRVQEASEQKGYKVNIAELLSIDDSRRDLLASVESLRQKRNEIAGSMKGGKPSAELVEEGKRIKAELATQEEELRAIDEQFLKLLKQVPNMPMPDVPVGASEDENVVVKTVGDKPEFAFEPKSHWQLAEARDWIDKERAAKVAGARFAYVKGELALLWLAVVNFGVSVLTNEETLKKIIADAGIDVPSTPFRLVFPPAVAKTDVYEATGRLNKEEQTYKLADDDLWLNASAEHTLCAMYYKEILDEAQLPLRYVGYTTAFRREAGTYGKDTEGIFRLHQFDKLEMESFTTGDTSLQEHFLMIAIQEYLMSQLGLPYQVLNKCTADIGKPNARGVDIEVWLPSQGKYRETHTADLITDYQTRSLQTRVRRTGGEVELAHTNDATAFSQRPLIGILENFQNEDGTVTVPEVLRPFLGGREVL